MRSTPLFEPERTAVDLWQGVPKEWEIKRLKWSVAEMFNGVWGDEPDGVNDIVCVRVADFDRTKNIVIDNPPTFRTVEPKLRKNRLLESGDLLIEKSGGGEKQLVGCVVQFTQDIEAVSSNFIARVHLNEGCHSRYFTYVHAALYSMNLNFPAIKQTTGIQNLDSDIYFDIKVAFPPLETQRRIADYLDRETARIDALVAEKEKMLALLEEKRTALISRAVTRGLNPNAPMKPSGLDWLGDIPAHWILKRGKWLFREIDVRTETGEETLLSLRMGAGLVPHHEVSDKPLEANDVIGFKVVKAGQMVINRMRAATGLIAVASQDGLVSPDYAVFDLQDDSVDLNYILELFKTPLVQAVFRSASKGMGTGSQGFLRLYSDNFLSLWFPMPELLEQKEILEFICDEKQQIREMRQLLENSINLLRERRAALITAAVTGQLDPEEMAA